MPEANIARVIGIDPKTLRKHYRDELDTGAIRANSRIAESLYRKALGDGAQSVTAAIFWLKTRAGWKETTVQEVAGPPPRLIIHWCPERTETVSPADRPARLIEMTRDRRE